MTIDFKNITSDNFNKKAIEVFQHQAKNTAVYREYLKYLGIKIASVDSIYKIPFLPISFFKSHKVFNQSKESVVFTSSGTTGLVSSKHYLSDLSLYEKSFKQAFELFYGDIKDYHILALLPSY